MTVPRLDYRKASPEAFEAMLAFSDYARRSGLDEKLLELVRLRASQLNGCAYCVDMHTKDARASGESEQRLYLVSVWREAPCYSERERAALEWTEALTLISRGPVPDGAYEAARKQFSEKELVDLSQAIIAINGWNRLAIAFQARAGEYQPRKR